MQIKDPLRIVRKGKDIKSYPVTDAGDARHGSKLTHHLSIINVENPSNLSIAPVPPQSPDPILSPVIILEPTAHAQRDPLPFQGNDLELGPQVEALGLQA